mgnify:FL=1|nr:MAG TPA: ERF superfamily protein [Caudoviricetes sp.]
MGIYQKLHQIQQSVRGLGKDKSGGQYQYVSGSKLLPIVREQMDKLGVLLKQEVIGIENTRQDYTVGRDNRPKSEILSKVSMRFTWIDVETGEKDENLFAANGQNDWEKGLGSALTYGERYFLLKYFHIPTDEDDCDNIDRKKELQGTHERSQDTPQPGTDTRKVLPHERFNDPKFMEWITKNVGVKTDANITYLLDHSFMNLTPENIKTIVANYRNYERSTTNQ